MSPERTFGNSGEFGTVGGIRDRSIVRDRGEPERIFHGSRLVATRSCIQRRPLELGTGSIFYNRSSFLDRKFCVRRARAGARQRPACKTRRHAWPERRAQSRLPSRIARLGEGTAAYSCSPVTATGGPTSDLWRGAPPTRNGASAATARCLVAFAWRPISNATIPPGKLGKVGGGSWDRPKRPKRPKSPTGPKVQIRNSPAGRLEP